MIFEYLLRELDRPLFVHFSSKEQRIAFEKYTWLRAREGEYDTRKN